MWISYDFSPFRFHFRFAIFTRYPIRFCCRRELDSIVSWVLNKCWLSNTGKKDENVVDEEEEDEEGGGENCDFSVRENIDIADAAVRLPALFDTMFGEILSYGSC